jgi:phosphoribosylanthranilate isomerase
VYEIFSEYTQHLDYLIKLQTVNLHFLRTRPFLKICCIKSAHEARMAWLAGADVLGFVAPMPSGPGTLLEVQIAQIVPTVPLPIASFLLTPKQTAREIIDQHHVCKTTALQLVDHVPFDELRMLRQALPGVSLVQVIHVQDDSSVQEALGVAPLVDAILLDSGNQKLSVKELGGTGRTHDWRISRIIREALDNLPQPKPMFLAGGLNANNVREAISFVQPHGLDVCSSVRTNDRLDLDKLRAFMQSISNP